MDAARGEHLARLKAAVLGGHSLATMGKWIRENTFLRGQLFSFKGHEYQEQILADPAREKVVRKCSQTGISELAARMALATVNILDSSTLIYTLPTAQFAKTFVKTRVDPIITTSPALRLAVHPTADNTEMKQFGQSFLYFKGTIGTAAAISIPADGLFHDEVDFSDQLVMSTYRSRLSHSEYKLKTEFSTPTVLGFGISESFETTRQHWYMLKCNHCNEQFAPDYYAHVKIPGYSGDLRDVTKDRLPHTNYRDAYLACPKCGGEPDRSPQYREWVVMNSDTNHDTAGFQIQPLDRTGKLPSELVKDSTEYSRVVDFINFGLGLPAEDKESTLTQGDVDACYVEGESPGFFVHVMGIDMGMRCHVIVSGVNSTGQMFTVHTEIVPLAQIAVRKVELAKQYRVSLVVMDSQPYTETLMRLQASDPNLYGAVYVTSKDLAPFAVKKEEEETEDGDLQVRQVNVNRNKALDALMEFIRSGNWLIRADANRPVLTLHLQDMKRVKGFTSDNEITYVWQKSAKGNDHFHHALLYCWVAAKMRGVAGSRILLPGGLLRSFKVKSPL